MASSWLFCFWIACSDCVWVRVAVCAIMSLVLIGLLGSWYFISATSSLRNMSLPIWSGRSADDVAGVVAYDVGSVPLTGELIGKGLSSQARMSTPVADEVLVAVRTLRLSPGSAGRTQ